VPNRQVGAEATQRAGRPRLRGAPNRLPRGLACGHPRRSRRTGKRHDKPSDQKCCSVYHTHASPPPVAFRGDAEDRRRSLPLSKAGAGSLLERRRAAGRQFGRNLAGTRLARREGRQPGSQFPRCGSGRHRRKRDVLHLTERPPSVQCFSLPALHGERHVQAEADRQHRRVCAPGTTATSTDVSRTPHPGVHHYN
jgi:hypothetical protein